MILEVEGTRPWGPSRKRVPECLKGPKTTYMLEHLHIQLLELLKNSPREVKRAHFRYILGTPGPTQEMELVGPGGEGPSRSPRFLQQWSPRPYTFDTSRHPATSGLSVSRRRCMLLGDR